MFQYALKRVLLFFPTLFGVILISFIIIQAVPGGPVEQAIFQHTIGATSEAGGASGSRNQHLMQKGLDAEQIDQLKALYGFDKPVGERFVGWVVNLFTFNFGDSYFHHRKVIDLIKDKLPVSVSLGLISFFLTYLICIPLGIARALREGSTFDVVSGGVVLLGYSIPGFVLGVFLIILFGGGSFWDLFPIRGLVSDNFAELTPSGKFLDYLHHLILPIFCMTIGSFAVMSNLTKNAVIENIRQQYALTARAKGLSEQRVLWKHIFRNSMIPLVTGFAGNFLALFFTSALLIETLFSLDGMGLLAYEAVIKRDYPIVMADLFFSSLLFILGNLLGDLMYVVVDPRISFDSNEVG